jgi:3-hydroxybutyrate dehydrogenase
MLKGKTALVTGSTSGIGLGIAKGPGCARAPRSCSTVLAITDGPQAEVKALGVKVGYHGADMSKPSEIEAMMQACAATDFGGVDILVNNAGIQHVARVEDFPVERWDAIIAINLSQCLPRHAPGPARHEAHAGWGRIINVASVHGLVASAEQVRLRGRQARHRRA